MKKSETLEDEIRKVRSLMGIEEDVNRSNVILKSNEFLQKTIRNAHNNWKLKAKIIIFIAMTIVGSEHQKESAIELLKEILQGNPELGSYSLGITQKLKMVASLPT